MQSNVRVFKEKGFDARENLLRHSEFKLFRDMPENAAITPESGAHFLREAEKMLGEEIPLLPLSLYREFKLTGVRSRFERLHHKRRDMLFYMTLAEAYERKGRFIQKIADLIWAILEETCWVIPAHYSHCPTNPNQEIPENYVESQTQGLDLYAANCCSTLAAARYLLKDELDKISPIICKRIDYQVILRGAIPFATVPYRWTGEINGGFVNNWVTDICSTILFATAVCVEDYELRCLVVNRAMRYLDNFTAHYPIDGFCDEGPGYWSGAGGNYFDCLELIEDMTGGKITAYDAKIVKNLGEYIANANIDESYYLNFADAKPKLEQPGKMIMRYGKKCGSEELYSFGKMAETKASPNRHRYFVNTYREIKDAMTPEVLLADKVLGKESVWYGENKIAIFREGTDTGKGLYLAMKGGNNHESHNHKDVGCIVVYSNGKPVIVDPAYGSYDNGFFGPTRYHRWYMKSSYHSVPSVNGFEEDTGPLAASSDESFDGATKTVSMELSGAFPKEAGILSMRRTAKMGEGEIRITDAVKLLADGDIHFNFTFVDKPEIISDGKIKISDGRMLEFNPEGTETVIEKVENTYLPYEDLKFDVLWNRECLWRLVIKSHSKEKELTVTIK